MRRNRLPLFLLVSVLAACEIPAASLHPLYEEDALVAVPALQGSWESDEDDLIYTFEETGEGTFAMTLEDSDDTAWHALVFAFELDGTLYLDVTGDLDVWADRAGPVPLAMAPLHMWFPIQVDDHTLQLEVIDHKTWVTTLTALGEDVVAFSDAQDTEYVVLPQDSEDLRRIVSTVFGSEDVERDRVVLERRSDR